MLPRQFFVLIYAKRRICRIIFRVTLVAVRTQVWAHGLLEMGTAFGFPAAWKDGERLRDREPVSPRDFAVLKVTGTAIVVGGIKVLLLVNAGNTPI
jgi:hypothetical protein